MEYNKYPEIRDKDGNVVWTAKPRQLKRGEKVSYELTNIKPSALDKTGQTLEIPFIMGVRKKDTIYVPIPREHQKELGDGVYVDIAFVKSYGRGGEPVFGDIHFLKADAGVITLIGGRAEDQAKFEYMEMCNANASNPNRDKTVPAVFTKIDYKERAEKRRNERKLRKQALNRVDDLTESDLVKIAISLGFYEDSVEPEKIRDMVEAYAEANSEKFLNKLENRDVDIEYIAYEANKKGLIKVDLGNRQITSATGSLLKSWTDDKTEWTKKFVEYVKSEEGEQFYHAIKDEIESADDSPKRRGRPKQ